MTIDQIQQALDAVRIDHCSCEGGLMPGHDGLDYTQCGSCRIIDDIEEEIVEQFKETETICTKP